MTYILYYFVLYPGFGYGCCLIPSFLIVQQYFKKRMGIAMGIALAGGGIGMFVMALLMQQLLSSYGWRGSLLILGAINANLCVAGALMRPVSHVYKARRFRQKSLGYIDIKTTTHEGGRMIPIVKRLQRKYSLSVVATYLKPSEDSTSSVNNKSSNETPDVNVVTFDLRDDVIMEEEEEAEVKEEDPLELNQIHNTSSVDNTTLDSNSHVEKPATETLKEPSNKQESCCCRYPRMVYSFFDSIYNFNLLKDPIYDFFQLSVLTGFIGMAIVTTHIVSVQK